MEVVILVNSESLVVIDAVLTVSFAEARVAVSWTRKTDSISEEVTSVTSLAAGCRARSAVASTANAQTSDDGLTVETAETSSVQVASSAVAWADGASGVRASDGVAEIALGTDLCVIESGSVFYTVDDKGID